MEVSDASFPVEYIKKPSSVDLLLPTLEGYLGAWYVAPIIWCNPFQKPTRGHGDISLLVWCGPGSGGPNGAPSSVTGLGWVSLDKFIWTEISILNIQIVRTNKSYFQF